jgi:AcrR family transcriptional regulator
MARPAGLLALASHSYAADTLCHMVSQHRNSRGMTADLTAHNAIDDDRILDAAYPLLLSLGLRRLTMADVARHVEVSRATLYRRWPNVRSLVAALITREWSRLAADVFDGRADDVRTRLVRAVVSIAAATRDHPLLRMIVELDPEFLLPYLLERRGTSTDMQLQLLATEIRAGQRDGSIRRGAPDTLAAAVLLTAISFVLSAPAIAADAKAVKRLDAELGRMINRYLEPQP